RGRSLPGVSRHQSAGPSPRAHHSAESDTHARRLEGRGRRVDRPPAPGGGPTGAAARRRRRLPPGGQLQGARGPDGAALSHAFTGRPRHALAAGMKTGGTPFAPRRAWVRIPTTPFTTFRVCHPTPSEKNDARKGNPFLAPLPPQLLPPQYVNKSWISSPSRLRSLTRWLS